MAPPGGPEDPTSLTPDQRYARVPGRSLESRYRYLVHARPGLAQALYFGGVLVTAVSLGWIPALALIFAGTWLRGRADRPFDVLLLASPEEAERVALEEVAREKPGPVADEYLTVAAIARAAQGDREGTRELLGRREAPVSSLHGLDRRLVRPLGAAAFEAVGETAAALELLGTLDPSTEDSGTTMLLASLLIAASRFRAAQRALDVAMERFTAPKVRKMLHALYLLLARETWDPEVEALVRGYQPETAAEAEIHLSGRLFLAELQGRPHDAELLSRKLLALRCQDQGVVLSEGFHDWRDALRSCQLHVEEVDDDGLEAALERAAAMRDRLPEAELENPEPGYLEAWLEVELALRRGRFADALVEGERDEVLDFQGAVLRACRILVLAQCMDRPDEAAREAISARRLAHEAPAVLAASAALRRLRGRPLDADDRFALRRASYAQALFPPAVRRLWQDLPEP